VALTDDQKAMLRLLAQREQGYDDIAALTGQDVDGVRSKVKDAIAALDGPGALADDQKAMLRLLAQREEGYGDIAALTGPDVGTVRSKVSAALAGLEGSSSPAGKAPPEPEPEPEAPAAPAATPAAKPAAKAAAAKPAKPETPKAAPTGRSSRSSSPRLKLPDDRGAVWGLGAGLAVVLLLVILLATGALGGGSDSSSSEPTTAETTTGGEGGTSTTASKELQPTQAILKPVDGGSASGRALFGKAKKQVVLLVRAKGLKPAPKGESYTLSLSKSSDERLPLVASQVTKSDELVGTFPIAPQALGLLASGFDEMELSIVADTELKAALAAARTAKKAPNYGGTLILSGPVTGAIVEAGEQGKVNP
jgi:hypothetical protein